MTGVATPLAAPGVVLEAPVRAVTLLEDRAQVRRRGTAALPAGRVTLRVRDLAPVLVDRSLHVAVRTPDGVAAGDAARVIDARVRRCYRPASRRGSSSGGDVEERVRKLEAELAALARRRETLGKQRELVDQTARQALADVLTDVAWEAAAPETWSAGLAALGDRELELRERDLDLGWHQEELRESMADLRRQAEAAERPDLLLAAEAEVELAVAAAGDFVVEVTYVVPAACWRPAHSARLLEAGQGSHSSPSGGTRVVFETDACVWQKTGEDWHDVELKFSTQRPTRGHEPPLLRDERIESRPKPEEIVVEAREVEIQTTGAGAGRRPARELPGIDDGGTSLTLSAEHRATLPSDGRPYRVRVSRFEAVVESEHVLIPELAPDEPGRRVRRKRLRQLAGHAAGRRRQDPEAALLDLEAQRRQGLTARASGKRSGGPGRSDPDPRRGNGMWYVWRKRLPMFLLAAWHGGCGVEAYLGGSSHVYRCPATLGNHGRASTSARKSCCSPSSGACNAQDHTFDRPFLGLAAKTPLPGPVQPPAARRMCGHGAGRRAGGRVSTFG